MNSRKPQTANPVTIDGEAHPVVVETAQPDSQDAIHLLTSLLVGGGIEATDLLINHARAWQQRFGDSPRLLTAPDEESSADLLRYALVGMIFDAEEQLRQQSGWWGEQLLRSIDKATEVSRPITDSWLMAPLRGPMQTFSRKIQSEGARLVRRGRIEEAVSRMMATEVTDEVISVVLDYLGDKPEVRRLIQEQGTSMAGEVVNEMRSQSEIADDYVEAVVRRVFSRTPRQASPQTGSQTSPQTGQKSPTSRS